MATARRTFWLAWLVATVIGGLLSLAFAWSVALPAISWVVGTVPASNVRDILQVAPRVIEGMAGAALIAVAQAVVLRRVLGNGVLWVTAAAVGALLAWVLNYWLGSQLVPHHLPRPSPTLLRVAGLIMFCVSSLVLASCSWIACLRRADPVGWYIVAAVVAAAVTDWYLTPLAWGPIFTHAALRVEYVMAGAAVQGSLTGLALAMTVIRPRPTPRRPSSGRPARSRRRRPARATSR